MGGRGVCLQVVGRFVRATVGYERSTGGLLIHGKHVCRSLYFGTPLMLNSNATEFTGKYVVENSAESPSQNL